MEELVLILPSIEYRSQIEKYKKDMLDAGSSMDGCGSLRHDDFDTWLQKCKEIGIDRVLVTCKDTKIASRKCIIANGGQYEDTRTIENENINIERYWINNVKEL